MIIDGRFEHNHAEPDDRTVQRLKVRQECKRKATDEPRERPNKIIMGEIATQDSTELVPEDVKSVRQAHPNTGKLCAIVPSLVSIVRNCNVTKWGHRGRDRMVVGFTITYAISANHD
jgi:hypothetical protein